MKLVSPSPSLRAAIILALATPLVLLWKYFGSHQFFIQQFGCLFAGERTLSTVAAAYRFGSGFLLLGVLPALVVKFVFRQRLADYGVRLGILKRTLRSCLLLVPVFLIAAWVAAQNAGVREVYPINRAAGTSAGMFALHAALYLLFYLGWEFFFRGFLLVGLQEGTGTANALWIQVLASSLAHIGDPAAESFAAIAAGLLWGIVALRTRSLLSGTLQHAVLGIALDWFLCFGPGAGEALRN